MPRPITSLAAACLLSACSAAAVPAPTPPASPPAATPATTTAPAPTAPPPASSAPPAASPLLVDPRCAVFLDAADLEASLGVATTSVTFLDSGLRPPPLIEVSCAWDLADGTRIRLEVDDLLWNGEHVLAAVVRDGQARATPVAGLGDLAFGFQDVAGTTVAWAIRHGGADRTLRLHAGSWPAEQVLALAARVHGDASPDLWVADLQPDPRASADP